jgi:hypothetical protein
MKQLFLVSLVLLASLTAAAQQRKIPVSVAHTGKDQVGSLFVDAFNRELARSSGYEPMSEGEKGFRFFVEFATVDVADAAAETGKRSAISVVIQQMGLPNSFPVADLWYHKVILVNRSTADATAKDLLEDLTAGWCRTYRNSVDGCPHEKF